jgi:hypothetical protein
MSTPEKFAPLKDRAPLTGNRAVVTDANGRLTVSNVTDTEIDNLDDGQNLTDPNRFKVSATTYAATVNLDFDGDSRQTLTLTGDVTLNTTNRGATAADGKGLAVKITASGADRAVTVNASWLWATGEPGTISSGDSGLLSLEVWGTAETDVIASWVLIG